MKRTSFFAALFILVSGLSKQSFGQYYFYNDSYYENPLLFEIGFSGGVMNCLTDLGGNKGVGKKFVKDLNLGTTQSNFGLFAQLNYKSVGAFRLEGTFGKVAAYDSVLKGVTDIARTRYLRNLNFQSSITEWSALVEVHPLFIIKNYELSDVPPPRISPYVLGGIGYYSFNPQGKVGDNIWVDLQPLSTEGQGFSEYPNKKPYKLNQINYPLGIGLRYELSPLMMVRGEFLYRFLTTDYLDDCSGTYIDPAVFYNHLSGSNLNNALILNDRQIDKYWGPGGKRGNPKNKDAFFSFNLKLSVALRQRILD